MDTALTGPEPMEAKVKMVKSMVGSEVSEPDVLKALSLSNNNVREAVDVILDSLHPHLAARETLTSTGGRRVQVNSSRDFGEGVSVNVEKRDCGVVDKCDAGVVRVKEEIDVGVAEEKRGFSDEKRAEIRVKEEPNVAIDVSIGRGEREGSVLTKCDAGVGAMEFLKVKEEPHVGFVEGEVLKVKEEPDLGFGDEKKDQSCDEKSLVLVGKVEEEARHEPSSVMAAIRVKEEGQAESEVTVTSRLRPEWEVKELVSVQPLSARKLSDDEYKKMQPGCDGHRAKKARTQENALSAVVIEDGDFPEELGWLLVGRTVVTGLSTTKGRKLENNEIVHFMFPGPATKTKLSTHFMSSKAAHAVSSIVRFSTKRYGEVHISA